MGEKEGGGVRRSQRGRHFRWEGSLAKHTYIFNHKTISALVVSARVNGEIMFFFDETNTVAYIFYTITLK